MTEISKLGKFFPSVKKKKKKKREKKEREILD
jgi:hypothetical protein